MTFQHKPNSGKIFKNSYKEKETHPDFKADFKIDHSILDENGMCSVAIWKSEDGSLSLKLSKKFVKKEQRVNAVVEDIDDSIPF